MTAATVATSASNTIDALEPFSKALENISTVVAGLLPSAIGLSRAFAGVGQAFTTVSSNFTGSVGNIGNALSGLGNAFVKVLPGNINGASAAAAAGLGGVASAIGSLGTAIPGVLGGMLGLGQALVGFVQVANPGVVQLFTKAFGDLEAVIGQALTPVLQIVTQVIRMGADALASFLPQLGSVIGAMLSSFMPVVKILLDALAMIGQGILLVFQAAQPLIEAFGMIYSAIYEAFMPVVKLMIELVSGALSQALKAISSVMTQILPYILAFTMYLKTLMERFADWIRDLLGLTGVTLPDFVKPEKDKSEGAAAKGTNLGSVESVIQTAMKNAFGSGAEDPAKKTATGVSELKAQAEKIFDEISNLTPSKIAGLIVQWGNNALQYIWKALEKAFNIGVADVGKWVDRAMEKLVEAINSMLPKNPLTGGIDVKSEKARGADLDERPENLQCEGQEPREATGGRITMPSQQPYTEAPADVFDPVMNQTDWLEIITSESSPGESSFNQETQEASLVGYVPWNKQRSAIAYFLGFASVNTTQQVLVVNGTPGLYKTLHRANPEAHPIFPWLYCSDVSLKAFNPVVNINNPSAPLQFVSPWFQGNNNTVTLNIANHKLAVCNLKFRNYRCSFLDDSVITDPRMEWMRNVYMETEPKVEALSADGIGQLYFAESGPTGPAPKKPFPAPVAELLGKATYKLYWLNVPYYYLSTVTDFFFPTNIMACLGTVNNQPFPYGSSTPFQPQTLLFDSVEFKQKTFPVAPADPSSPLLSVDVAMTMHYFNPPLGATSPIAYGHNNMPNRSDGLFYYATRDGTPTGAPLLQSTDFNQMFLSAP